MNYTKILEELNQASVFDLANSTLRDIDILTGIPQS